MQYRALGDSDLEVSAIGFGGWPMGGHRYGGSNDDEEVGAVRRALDTGINLFDTASGYGLGHSETVLGWALKGRWDDVVVVTKTGICWEEASQRFVRDSRPEQIQEQCEASLRNLGTDRIDVYLIHWPDPDTQMDVTMRAMENLQDAGKIAYVGVSNFPPALMDQARAVVSIITNQVGYHMLDRRNADQIIPYCAANEIGVMAYGSLAHGVLTGAFTEDPQFDDDDWRKSGYAFGLPLFHPRHLPATLEAVDEVTGAAASAGLTTSQLALRWVLEEPAISTALVGFRNAEEVDSAVAALESELPNGVLDAANVATRTSYDRLLMAEQPAREIGPGQRTS